MITNTFREYLESRVNRTNYCSMAAEKLKTLGIAFKMYYADVISIPCGKFYTLRICAESNFNFDIKLYVNEEYKFIHLTYVKYTDIDKLIDLTVNLISYYTAKSIEDEVNKI